MNFFQQIFPETKPKSKSKAPLGFKIKSVKTPQEIASIEAQEAAIMAANEADKLWKMNIAINSGNHNTAFGANSLLANTTGSNSTALGSNALPGIGGYSGTSGLDGSSGYSGTYGTSGTGWNGYPNKKDRKKLKVRLRINSML